MKSKVLTDKLLLVRASHMYTYASIVIKCLKSKVLAQITAREST